MPLAVTASAWDNKRPSLHHFRLENMTSFSSSVISEGSKQSTSGKHLSMDQSVPRLSVQIDENDLIDGAFKVLQKIRPTWKRCDVEFKLLTDGITNKLVGCRLRNGSDADTVLVRVYGNKTDLLIDRKAETRNILLLNKAGLAPQLFATFQNGLAYEFVPGQTLSDETVILPHIYKLVARNMARLHKVNAANGSEPRPCLWNKLQQFLDLVPDKFSDCDKQKRFENTVISKEKLRQEIKYLEEILTKLDNPIVFCHNDLLLGNVIYTKEENSVTFIDYEYAALNYQAFDIGNHFAEFVGVGVDLDYNKYPNEGLQKDWIRTYLVEYKGEASQEDVDKLYVDVNKFVLAAHVFWGIWALIQAEHSYIDFDFLGYAATRFNEYFARKDSFSSLEIPR